MYFLWGICLLVPDPLHGTLVVPTQVEQDTTLEVIPAIAVPLQSMPTSVEVFSGDFDDHDDEEGGESAAKRQKTD